MGLKNWVCASEPFGVNVVASRGQTRDCASAKSPDSGYRLLMFICVRDPTRVKSHSSQISGHFLTRLNVFCACLFPNSSERQTSVRARQEFSRQDAERLRTAGVCGRNSNLADFVLKSSAVFDR